MILHRYKFISFYQWMYYNSYLHRNAILLKEDKEGCFFFIKRKSLLHFQDAGEPRITGK